jgi:hypothetical protein
MRLRVLLLRLLFSALAASALLLSAPSLNAQTRDTAIVRGRVLDPQGLPIPGAQVALRNTTLGISWNTQTSSDGAFALVDLPLTGRYSLAVSKSGFRGARRENMELRGGEAATVELKLGVASMESTMTVLGTVDTVSVDSAKIETRFDLQSVDNLPINARKLTSVPLLDASVRSARGTGDLFIGETLFVINGSGRRQINYSVDNATGDDSWGRQTVFTTLPFTAVQELSVLTNGTSAEYGRNAGGAVNIVTKSGTNEFHGDLLENWRPGDPQASQPLAIKHTADMLRQTSGAFSGPLVKKRTFFLASAEYNYGNRDAVITSPQDFGHVFTGRVRQTLLNARVDHNLTSRNNLMLRLNLDRLLDSNPNDGVSGNNVASTQRVFNRNTYSVQLSETAALRPTLVNQFRFIFQLGDPITRFTPVTPSVQIVYPAPNAATFGISTAADLMNHQYEWADTLTWIEGHHSLKFGADVIYSSAGGFGLEFGAGPVLGQFTVSSASVNVPFNQLTIANMASYTQSQGNQSYNIKEALYGLFVQDDISLRSDLTLNVGLRYEGQTLTQGNKNFAPRVGFAYRFPWSRATVLRGSYGIYTSEIRINYAAGDIITGPLGAYTYTANAGQLGFPTSLTAVPVVFSQTPAPGTLPPRNITVRPGQRAFLNQFFNVSLLRGYPDRLLNPNTQQWALSVEREFATGWVASISYVGSHTVHIDRPVDLNAPASFLPTTQGEFRTCPQFPVSPTASASAKQAAAQNCADLTRPIVPVPGGYRMITASVNAGAATYHGLQTKLVKHFGQHYSLLFTYTYSHALNTVEPDAPSQNPQDSNRIGNFEKAASVLNQPHRAVLTGWYEFPWQISAGTSTSLASGRPFNVTTGNDNNGDGVNSDRPILMGGVVPRNFGQGTPLYSVDLFLQKNFRIAESVNLTFRAESFNTLNHYNIVGRNGTFGQSAAPLATFGTPLGGLTNIEPIRQLQFMARVRF